LPEVLEGNQLRAQTIAPPELATDEVIPNAELVFIRKIMLFPVH